MKHRSANFRFALCLGLICLAGSPQSAPAPTFTFPGTVASAGAEWYVSDNVNGVVPFPGNPGPGGFGFSDAEFSNMAAGLDAYDGGFVMRINGTLFASPPGTAAINGNVLTSGTANYAGLATQVEFRFDQTRPIVRSLYSFTNPSASPITATFRWEVNLGSDANTVVRATSSGDAVSDLSDRWLVTSDNGGGDLVNTLVRYGTNAPHPPDSATYLPGDPARDLLADGYSVNVPAGQTVRLMMFGQLNSVADGLNNGVTAAITNAMALFTDYDALRAAGLFDGLPGDLSSIINWGLPIPEPGVGALLASGVVAALLRWRFTRNRRRSVHSDLRCRGEPGEGVVPDEIECR